MRIKKNVNKGIVFDLKPNLRTDSTRNLWSTVRRITVEIVRVKWLTSTDLCERLKTLYNWSVASATT